MTVPTMMADEYHERYDIFSQRGNKSKKGATIIKEGLMPVRKPDQKDASYVIDSSIHVEDGPKSCLFC